MNLIIESLNFSYRNEEVFKDLNLNFKSEVLNLISGPSGSGKTTLLNLIAGLEKPSSGLIILDDIIQSNNDKFVEPENRNIGFVFQDFALFPHLNVKQNIEFSRKGNEDLFNKLINRLNIASHLSKYPHELSGGQQQRVSIARALFSEPKILLIDEPISNQDKNNKIEIIEIISEFIKEKEIICILVSHEEINSYGEVEARSYNLS
ncbi:MAG: ABC transporter ATP-binding protein [Gammaproteobacteria bacterium]|tara:strand:+ start:347 stop:964 length:618 start_codon:yes stop_codon:yes gene_type:complete